MAAVSAALAWPFATGGQPTERYEWLTDGMSPTYGMEFTQRLRRDPRMVLAFDGLESGANRRWMENAVAVWGARRWHVPLVCDAGTTTAAADSGTTVVSVDTRHRRYVAGGNAMLQVQDEPARTEVVEIAAVLEDAIELVGELVSDWPARSPIMPTVTAWLDKAPQFDRFTGGDAPYSIAFRAAEPVSLPADFGDAEHRGVPVFEQPVYWTQDPAYTAERRIATLDNGIGPILLHDQGGMVLPQIQAEVTTVGAAEIAAHRALIAALAGRHHPIWVPSFAQDFRLLSVSSATTLDVEWSGFSIWPLQENRRDIRLELVGAAPLYRRIASAGSDGAGGERLVLDAALPTGIGLEDVASISLMALCRQDADVNSLRLWSHGVVQSQMAFVGCRHGL